LLWPNNLLLLVFFLYLHLQQKELAFFFSNEYQVKISDVLYE
jgi:hypothetical protein